MKAFVTLAVLISPLAVRAAHADQCAWIDPTHAARAEAILAARPPLVAFCEPCGEVAPGEPFVPRAIEVRTPTPGTRELVVDGRGIDLAYVFVKTSDTRYGNLARLVGCPATGVSRALAIESETAHGVMITATGANDEPAPAAPQVSAPAAPAPAAPRIVFELTTHTRASVPWLGIGLASAAGLLAALSGLGLAAWLRRRRAMRPRAVDIRPGT